MAEAVPRSLVDYGDDEEEEDSGARSSDDDLLVPRKRVRVQNIEEGMSKFAITIEMIFTAL